jgi:phosphoenolpyruvate-protein kinase (PTS system EI component)
MMVQVYASLKIYSLSKEVAFVMVAQEETIGEAEDNLVAERVEDVKDVSHQITKAKK